MYLGETKSPGQEFSYVRIFNNVVINTKREAIQIANMVEDVQVYNNILLNNGTDKIPGQGNNLQIGDNSVADVFNNIIIGSVEYGVIVFGLGHINIYSNYIAQSNGIFIDNRKYTDEHSFLKIWDNYFKDIRTDEVILNYNELNEWMAFENYYEPIKRFFHSNCTDCVKHSVNNNIETAVVEFKFHESDSVFYENSSLNPLAYLNMGLSNTTEFEFNSWPEFELLENMYVNAGDSARFRIKAITHDSDSIVFLFENLPEFAEIQTIENGVVELFINALDQEISIYPIFVTAVDKSHGVEIRAPFEIVIKSKANTIPLLDISTYNEFYNLEKSKIDFTVYDADNDLVEVTIDDAPYFIELVKLNNAEFQLVLKPGFSDSGDYTFNIKVDDGFSGIVEGQITIKIIPKILEPGDVVYRYNFGGPELHAEPINWQKGNHALYNITDQNLQFTGSYAWKGINNTNAPDSLFGPYAFIKPDDRNMYLHFPCEPNNYLVKIYNTIKPDELDSIGETHYNVFAEGDVAISDLIIGDEASGKAQLSMFNIEVFDSVLDISVNPVKNFVRINGIEISISSPFSNGYQNLQTSIFPNPFNESIHIINNELNPIIDWGIYNTSGKISLVEKPLNYYVPFYNLNTKHLNKGIYFLYIKRRSGAKVYKVLHE